jgi:integrase
VGKGGFEPEQGVALFCRDLRVAWAGRATGELSGALSALPQTTLADTLTDMRDPRTLSESLSDYFEHRRGRYSASTWKAHEGQLERMRTWCAKELGSHLLITDVDERAMVRYFNQLRPPYRSANTYNNYRTYLRLFWTFCKEEGWIDRNPMRHVDPARQQKKVRLRLSAAELLQMLEGASPRDRVGLALGMNTALRAHDITALKVGSANLTNNLLTAWIEKTDTEELLPITSELRVELLRWFQHYAEVHGCTVESLPNDWTLMPPAHFQGFDVNQPSLGGAVVYKTHGRYRHPEQIVQRGLVRLGHPTKQEGFHTLRRSSLRAVYELAKRKGNGDPLRIAQAMAGHANRSTTEAYLGITIEKQMRDELLRGQSFLQEAADADRAEVASQDDRRDDRGSRSA